VDESQVGQASACLLLNFAAWAEVKPDKLNSLRGKKASICHSERSEESLFDLSIRKKQGEILRFAQNDSVLSFSAACEV
jgi:hypothetical protein